MNMFMYMYSRNFVMGVILVVYYCRTYYKDVHTNSAQGIFAVLARV
jgi:hypothetical protein